MYLLIISKTTIHEMLIKIKKLLHVNIDIFIFKNFQKMY